jgi:hypothetical protein
MWNSIHGKRTQTTIYNIQKRFWEKVKKNLITGCWEWQGYKTKFGHGQFQTLAKVDYAHRYSWQLVYGEIPKGLFVLHRCDNGCCVNPAHLYIGTQTDNIRDMVNRGRTRYDKNRATGIRNGKYTHPEKTPRGEKHGMAKLTQMQVDEIRNKYKYRIYPQSKLAKEYHVSEDLIYKIINRKLWK